MPLPARQSSVIWLACLCLLAPFGLNAVVAVGWVVVPGALPTPRQLLVMLIAAPIIEELVFRGHMQPWLTTHFAGKAAAGQKAHAAAIAATSLVFVALHWLANPTPVMGWVALPSVALGVLQAKGGRWQLCALLHSSFNAVWCWTIWLQAR